MSIEFNCSQCGKLLRVGDDAAGKQAKCPACNTVQAIPSAAATAQSPFDIAPPAPRPALTRADSEVNPYQSPLGSRTTEPLEQIGRSDIRPTIVAVVDPIASAWAICKQNVVQFLMCLVVMAICLAINYASQLLVQGVIAGVGAIRAPIVVTITILSGVIVAQSLFQIWIGIGQTLYFLKTARGEDVSLGVVFSGAPYLVSTILASLIIGVALLVPATVVGVLAYAATRDPPTALLAALLPFFLIGLYLMLTYFPYYFLIPDQGLGPLESLRVSEEITRGNRLTIFLLVLISIPVFFISAMCCLPMLFTMPFAVLVAAVLYLQMAGQPTADRLTLERQSAPRFAPPNPEFR